MWKLFVKMYPEWLNKHPHLSTTEVAVLRLSHQLNGVFINPSCDYYNSPSLDGRASGLRLVPTAGLISLRAPA